MDVSGIPVELGSPPNPWIASVSEAASLPRRTDPPDWRREGIVAPPEEWEDGAGSR